MVGADRNIHSKHSSRSHVSAPSLPASSAARPVAVNLVKPPRAVNQWCETLHRYDEQQPVDQSVTSTFPPAHAVVSRSASLAISCPCENAPSFPRVLPTATTSTQHGCALHALGGFGMPGGWLYAQRGVIPPALSITSGSWPPLAASQALQMVLRR